MLRYIHVCRINNNSHVFASSIFLQPSSPL